MTDSEIVKRILGGDPALFETLMRRHNQRMYRAVRAILRSDDEVDDVVQQAYLNAYAHLDQFAGTAQFSTWLTRIAVNEALAHRRRRGMPSTASPGLCSGPADLTSASGQVSGSVGVDARTPMTPSIFPVPGAQSR